MNTLEFYQQTYTYDTGNNLTNLSHQKPSFCQNKKIVAIASHFLKFQAQAAINTRPLHK
jgi:hypothetical protein